MVKIILTYSIVIWLNLHSKVDHLGHPASFHFSINLFRLEENRGSWHFFKFIIIHA